MAISARSLTVTLTPEQSNQLDGLISEGRFRSANDAIAHSLDLLWEEAAGVAVYTLSAGARVREGIKASLNGDCVSNDEVETFFREWKRDLHT